MRQNLHEGNDVVRLSVLAEKRLETIPTCKISVQDQKSCLKRATLSCTQGATTVRTTSLLNKNNSACTVGAHKATLRTRPLTIIRLDLRHH